MRGSIFRMMLAFISCAEVDSPKDISSYYNLDSLLNAQVDELVRINPQVTKKVSIDGLSESLMLRLDSIQWTKELAAVRDLELNRAKFIGALDIENTAGVLRYTPKPSEDIPVKWVEYHFDQEGITALKGKYVDDKASTIYTTVRNVELLFDHGKMKSYKYSGYQKMVLKDTTWYEIFGELN
jgi:hypothetical protein